MEEIAELKNSIKLSCKLYKLKGITNLEQVNKKILTREASQEVRLTREDKKNGIILPGDEGVYNFCWDEFSEMETLEIHTKDELNKDVIVSIKYIAAISRLEYGKQKKRKNKQYLPKNQRINEAFVRVIFFEMNEEIYLVICTSQKSNIDRVVYLLGKENVIEDESFYVIPDDFFNWFFYKFSEFNGELGYNYRLRNIVGFIGNVTDEQNIIKGKSEQTFNLMVTKAFISNGEKLQSITARIRKEEEMDIVFGVNKKCDAVIYVNQSESLLLFQNKDKDALVLLYLYGVLIPRLLRLYRKNEVMFLGEQKKVFSKKIGLEVIKSIMEHNNIGIEDIKNA